ncbi:MAG TPA: SHOCT domain-containing protein [Asticcacaulis sp.]|nr:SHOCT domain-containing protein [Asticcacaulis sp.]
MTWHNLCTLRGMTYDGLFQSALVLVLLGAIVVYFKIAHNKPLSLHMLDERYAKGEIDRDEYLRCKADLRSGR